MAGSFADGLVGVPLASDLLLAHEFAARFEDRRSQEAALRLIPVDRLEESVSRASVAPEERRDALLYALVRWFADEFFAWFEAPACGACGASLQAGAVRHVAPVPGQLASRFEEYTCVSCPAATAGSGHLFFRYNHPAKLLETRVGRCGEWANCFGLCCRALQYQVRWVCDRQDHVWLEVYSERQRRWLHCDPCERAVDRPHIYERGWGKRLAYVLAGACHQVADVTHRYSVDFAATNRRRTLLSEPALARLLVELDRRLQRHLPDERRTDLARCRIVELLQLLVPPAAAAAGGREEEQQGRQSGSLAWRMARGEAGTDTAAGYQFVPSPAELTAGQLSFSYTSARDVYRRGSDEIDATGWRRRLWRESHMQRKVERDWRKVYLCRAEGAECGCVAWRVDLGGDRVCERVQVQCVGTVFHGASIQWTLSGDNEAVVQSVPAASCQLITDQLAGCRQLQLSALLEGSAGHNAFQHAQLLRADLGDESTRLTFTVWFRAKPH